MLFLASTMREHNHGAPPIAIELWLGDNMNKTALVLPRLEAIRA